MRKIWNITRKDLHETFTNRNLLLIMIATPLALATIIALAFGGVSGGSSAGVADIPVVIVNLDSTTENNQGAVYVNAFVPPADRLIPEATPAADAASDATSQAGAASETPDCIAEDGSSSENPLYTLTAAVEMNDAAAARAAVDAGTYAAAVIIPEGFTDSLNQFVSATAGQPGVTLPESIAIEVYGDAARSVSASIVRSIVGGITNQIVTGYVSIAASLQTVGQEFGPFAIASAAQSSGFNEGVACAFAGAYNNVTLENQSVEGETDDFNLLLYFGSGQAIFFALFTANGSAASILEERRNGTLQRMVVSPTRRIAILFGKLFATFVMILVQLVLLFIALTVVASILEGQFMFIWGTNPPALVLMLFAASIAAAGLGSIVAAAAKSAEQAGIVGSVVSLAMGALGGVFFIIPRDGSFIDLLSRFSVVRWGNEGFTLLASGTGDVTPHILVLAAFGVVTFIIGLMIFNRRLDI